jgi:hypothetical protein
MTILSISITYEIRIRLELANQRRDLALFNLAIDSKLRGCDLISLWARDVVNGDRILPRAMILQRKTQQPVRFEITQPTRDSISAWISHARLASVQFLFPSRRRDSPHLTTRQ